MAGTNLANIMILWSARASDRKVWNLLSQMLAEVKSMESIKTYFRISSLFTALILLGSTPAKGQTMTDDFYREWIDYRDGEISLTFEKIPVQFALYAIHAKTGFQIVIPSKSTTKLVNLRLDRQPLEPAIRSLISTIGYKNFALMYDNDGHPHRAVVLEAQAQPVTVVQSDVTAQPLTTDERDKLHKDLARWSDLKQEERGRIEDRLKNLPPSDEREQLFKEYGQQVLAFSK